MRTIVCVNTKWQKEKRMVKAWNNQTEVEAHNFKVKGYFLQKSIIDIRLELQAVEALF